MLWRCWHFLKFYQGNSIIFLNELSKGDELINETRQFLLKLMHWLYNAQNYA
jgi:hypothetical protein